MTKASTVTTTNFVSAQEAPTPTISNRVAPIKIPPPLFLNEGSPLEIPEINGGHYHYRVNGDSPRNAPGYTAPTTSNGEQKTERRPRFSDPTASPIVVQRRWNTESSLRLGMSSSWNDSKVNGYPSATFATTADSFGNDDHDDSPPSVSKPFPPPLMAMACPSEDTIATLAMSNILLERSSSRTTGSSNSSSSNSGTMRDAWRMAWRVSLLLVFDVLKSGLIWRCPPHIWLRAFPTIWNRLASKNRRSQIQDRKTPGFSASAGSIHKNNKHQHHLLAAHSQGAASPQHQTQQKQKIQQQQQQQQHVKPTTSSFKTHSSNPWTTGQRIQGIPNYGQTCFLNSVLQALASLEPILCYLERIVQVQQERETVRINTDTSPDQDGGGLATVTTPNTTFSTIKLPWREANSGSKRTPIDFTKQLLQVLQWLNHGTSTLTGYEQSQRTRFGRFALDPRPLLQRIGETNQQFHHQLEQQDAHELLQAMLGVVIEDAQLDTHHGNMYFWRDLYQPMGKGKGANDDDDDDDDDDSTLTTVLAGGEHLATAPMAVSRPPEWSPANSIAPGLANHSGTMTSSTLSIKRGDDGDLSGGGDSVLSLSCLLERMDAEQRSLMDSRERQRQRNYHVVETNAKLVKEVPLPTTGTISTATSSTATSPPSSPPEREEKKEEDFEISIPFVSSEDDLLKLGQLSTAVHPTIPNGHSKRLMDDSSLTDASSDDMSATNDYHPQQSKSKTSPISKSAISSMTVSPITSSPDLTATDDEAQDHQEQLSTSMQIMKTTISAITPSPLSGWLGSTLRCCNCKHVRPIQNAPFLDIPVVPTSVVFIICIDVDSCS